MKLVVNMMMGTMMTTLAEGLTLAQKADLDQKQLVEVLGLGVMNCPLFAMKVRTSPHCTSFFPYCFRLDKMPGLLPLLFGCVSIGFRRLLVQRETTWALRMNSACSLSGAMQATVSCIMLQLMCDSLHAQRRQAACQLHA